MTQKDAVERRSSVITVFNFRSWKQCYLGVLGGVDLLSAENTAEQLEC